MKRTIIAFLLFVISGLMVFSCESPVKKNAYDTPGEGTINISVDETFKPVIEEQIKVYTSSFPKTRINASYKPEADCFRDLQSDSTRMIIVARGLTDEEIRFYRGRLGYKPSYGVLAYDAVAVIVNKNANDTVITQEQLSSYLSGRAGDKPVVLDGKNATSTIRFVMDSILRGEDFGNNVMAAKSTDEVIDFVSKNANAIGMIGMSWISDPTNPEHQEYLKKIKLALVECKYCDDGTFARPSPATILQGQYSLVRGVYYILKENATGLGTGFMNFMSLERGQLIFRRANLVPARMGFQKRRTNIREEQ